MSTVERPDILEWMKTPDPVTGRTRGYTQAAKKFGMTREEVMAVASFKGTKSKPKPVRPKRKRKTAERTPETEPAEETKVGRPSNRIPIKDVPAVDLDRSHPDQVLDSLERAEWSVRHFLSLGTAAGANAAARWQTVATNLSKQLAAMKAEGRVAMDELSAEEREERWVQFLTRAPNSYLLHAVAEIRRRQGSTE